jgi:hypothetical protein
MVPGTNHSEALHGGIGCQSSNSIAGVFNGADVSGVAYSTARLAK